MKMIKLLITVFMLVYLFNSSGMAETVAKNVNDSKAEVYRQDTGDCSQVDPRSYQHGISIIPASGGRYYLIWSSSGNPPVGEMADGNWSHDVYYSILKPGNPVIKPTKLVSRPEAQEPSSAAQTLDGHIMVTMEDGWNIENEVGQRYGIYDKNLKPILPYPQMILDGGHSGHVATVGNRFVVFYSSDWVDGGGFNNLGSGKDVLAAVYDSRGKRLFNKDIAVNNDRNCWPLIAGSETGACLVWQHFSTGQTSADLMFAILDPASGKYVGIPVKIHSNVKFYHYSVAYVSSIKRFIILGADEGDKGFGYLIDNKGKITAVNQDLLPVMRESNPVMGKLKGKPVVGMITMPTGAAVLSVTASEIKVKQIIKDNYKWQYCGTDGIFTDENQLLILSLSTNGMVQKKFDVFEK